MNKLENIMLRYFELINSLPYDEVKMATSLMEPMGIVVLTIYVKTMDEKYLYQKMINRKRVIKRRSNSINNIGGDVFGVGNGSVRWIIN
jgi:hypothetical protein